MSKTMSDLIGFTVYTSPEFETLLPKRKDDSLLKAHLIKYGFRDNFVYWQNPEDGMPTLLDGHRRYRIWEKCKAEFNGAEPSFVGIDFPDEAAAKQWCIENQDARRNWATKAERDEVLAARLKEEQAKSPTPAERGAMKGKTEEEKAVRRSGGQLPVGTAAERVSAETGVPTRTVERAAHNVDDRRLAIAALRQIDNGFAEQIEKKTFDLPTAKLQQLAKMPSKDAVATIKLIRVNDGKWPKAESNGKAQKRQPKQGKEVGVAKLADNLVKQVGAVMRGADDLSKLIGGKGEHLQGVRLALNEALAHLEAMRGGNR